MSVERAPAIVEAKDYFKKMGTELRQLPDRSDRKARLDEFRKQPEYPVHFRLLRKDSDNNKKIKKEFEIFSEETVRSNKKVTDALVIKFLGSDEASGKRILNIVKGSASVNGDYVPIVKPHVEGEDEDKEFTIHISSLRIMARGCTLYDIFRRRRNFFKEEMSDEQLSSYLDFLDFSHIGIATMLVEGINLIDFTNEKSKASIPQLYRFLASCAQAAATGNFETIIRQQDAEIQKKYPGILENYVYGLVTFLYPPFPDPPTIGNNVQDKIIKDLRKGIARVSKKIQDALFDPSNPEHDKILEVFQQFTLGEEKINFTLNCLGVFDVNAAIDTYRKAKKMVQDGIAPECYGAMADAIRDLITGGDERSNNFNVITEDDIQSIINNGVEKTLEAEEEVVQPRILGKLVREVLDKSWQESYNVDPTKVVWGEMVSPKSVLVNLNHKSPNKFVVRFFWENQEGEQLSIGISVDTKLPGMDWNILEAPDDPDMVKARDIMLKAIEQTLLIIRKTVIEEIKSNGTAKTIAIKVPKSKNQTAERPVDEVYALRRQIRAEARNGRSSTGIFAGEMVSSPDKIKPQVIDISQRDGIKEIILEAVKDPTIMGQILDAIDEFNSQEDVKLQRLQGRTEDGRPRYKLRIGDYRVVLIEKNGNGSRLFEVLAVGKRSDVYKEK